MSRQFAVGANNPSALAQPIAVMKVSTPVAAMAPSI